MQHLIAALLVFAVLYSLTNAYSAALFASYPERIYTLAIAFDSNIAFISAMIIPYSWSLILFVASFFMVRSPDQLTRLSARLIIATLLACLVFYLYPARFSFVRPLSADWTMLGYQLLSVTDKPFNQFPSLHVSYAVLLGWSLWKVVKSDKGRIVAFVYRLALATVCLLIIISTVFTYQHHLLDILGGLVLAGLVLFIVDKLYSVLVLKYLTVAIAGFLLIAIGGFFISEAMNNAWFTYIGLTIGIYWLVSFMILAQLYQINAIRANKNWFKKNDKGNLTLLTWLSFAPLLLGYKIMSSLGQLYFSYRSNKGATPFKTVPKISWYKINERISTTATARLASPRFIQDKIKEPYQLIVIDVAAEMDSHFCLAQDYSIRQNTQSNSATKTHPTDAKKPMIHYLSLPLLDLQPFQDADAVLLLTLFKQIDRAIVADSDLNKSTSSNSNSLSNSNNNYLTAITLLNFHCVMGFSRSVAVQVLYLVYCDKLDVESYREWINQYYPKAHLAEHYLPKSLVRIILNNRNLLS